MLLRNYLNPELFSMEQIQSQSLYSFHSRVGTVPWSEIILLLIKLLILICIECWSIQTWVRAQERV